MKQQITIILIDFWQFGMKLTALTFKPPGTFFLCFFLSFKKIILPEFFLSQKKEEKKDRRNPWDLKLPVWRPETLKESASRKGFETKVNVVYVAPISYRLENIFEENNWPNEKKKKEEIHLYNHEKKLLSRLIRHWHQHRLRVYQCNLYAMQSIDKSWWHLEFLEKVMFVWQNSCMRPANYIKKKKVFFIKEKFLFCVSLSSHLLLTRRKAESENYWLQGKGMVHALSKIS